MRLGLSSPLPHECAEDWAEQMVKIGCRSVNFPISYDAPDHMIADYADAARKHGLTIAEVGIWKNVLAADPVERENARKFAAGQLRMADAIGAKCCVNTAGTYGGPIWDGGYAQNFTKECRESTVCYIQDLLDEVRPIRTKFSVEPMPWMIPTSPDDCLALLSEVDRESFGIHLDVINMVNRPERYFGLDEFVDECFDKLGPLILSCHLKDIILNQALTFQLVETECGKGILNLERFAAHVNKIDPEMPVIIEHLDSPQQYLRSIAYVRERLNVAGIAC